MSLTFKDLRAIRTIVEETIDPLKGELEALGNDVKDIYEMFAELQKNSIKSDSIVKQSLEQKTLSLHASLTEAAKQTGITLPSH